MAFQSLGYLRKDTRSLRKHNQLYGDLAGRGAKGGHLKILNGKVV